MEHKADKPRGRAARGGKFNVYSRDVAISKNKINCNRGAQGSTTYPREGKHWTTFQQGNKVVKCAEKKSRGERAEMDPVYVNIMTERGLERGINNYAASQLLHQTLNKLTPEQVAQVRGYVIAPTTFTRFFTEGMERVHARNVDHSFFAAVSSNNSLYNTGHIVAVRFNPVRRTATIFEQMSQEAYDRRVRPVVVATDAELDQEIREMRAGQYDYYQPMTTTAAMVIGFRSYGYTVKVQINTTQQTHPEDNGCGVYAVQNMVDLMKGKPLRNRISKRKVAAAREHAKRELRGRGVAVFY